MKSNLPVLAAILVIGSIVSAQNEICKAAGNCLLQPDSVFVVQRNGPEIRFLALDLETGLLQSTEKRLRKRIDANAESFASDSASMRVYVISTSVPAHLLELDLSDGSNVIVLHENDVALPWGQGKNVWNIAIWDGSGSHESVLLGLVPLGFNSAVVAINASTGIATLASNNTLGPPVKGVYTFGSGRYFYLVNSASNKTLVVFDPVKKTSDAWSHDAFDLLVSMSFDQQNSLLLGTFASGAYSTLVRIIDWEARDFSVITDFAGLIPAAYLSGYEVSAPLGPRQAILRSDSGYVQLTRSYSGLNWINFDQEKFTSLPLADVLGFVVFRHFQPVIINTTPAILKVSGATPVTVSGKDFGYKNYVINSSLLGRTSEISVQSFWVSDTSLVFIAPARSYLGPAKLLLSFIQGSATYMLNYAPSWENFNPTEANAAGGENITVSGAGFMVSSFYRCNWTSAGGRFVSTVGVVVSNVSIVCPSPSWGYSASCMGFQCQVLLNLQLLRRADASFEEAIGSGQTLAIRPGEPHSLVILRGQTQNIKVGSVAEDPFVVAVQDLQGINCEDGSIYTLDIMLINCSSQADRHVASINSSKSVIVTQNLTLPLSASGCSIRFTLVGFALTAVSAKLTMITGNPSSFIVSNLSSRVQGGTPFGISLKILDIQGNLVQDNVTLEASLLRHDIGSQLGGITSVNSINGTVLFSNLIINAAGANNTLLFTIPYTLVHVESESFDVYVGSPFKVQLNWTVVNSPYTSMQRILPFPIVWAVDAGGNFIQSNLSFMAELHAFNNWQLALFRNFSASSSLRGITMASSQNGVAVFNDLAVSRKGQGYYFAFASSGLQNVTSATFNVQAGNASRLYILVQPGNGISTVVLGIQPSIQVLDEGNNTVNSPYSINATIPGRPPMNIRGHSSIPPVAGVAEFTDLAIVPAGQIRLEFLSSGLKSAMSQQFEILVGPPSQLVVLSMPQVGLGGLVLNPQPSVTIADSGGNVVSNISASVNASLRPNGTAHLLGNTSILTINGTALFTDLAVDRVGLGYILDFSAVLPFQTLQVSSSQFVILIGDAFSLVIVQQPVFAYGGETFFPPIVVRAADAGGNIIDISRSITQYIEVNISSAARFNAMIVGQPVVAVMNGSAVFADLSVQHYLGPLIVSVRDAQGVLKSVNSSVIQIYAGPPTYLVLVQQPSATSFAASVFGQQPKVRVTDRGWNTITNYSVGVNVTLNPAQSYSNTSLFLQGLVASVVDFWYSANVSILGTVQASFFLGIANFTDLYVLRAGKNFTLLFRSGNLTCVSAPFAVDTGAVARMILVSFPNVSLGGEKFPTQPKLVFVDAGNNFLIPPNASLSVYLMFQSSISAVLYGNKTIAVNREQVTFTDLALDHVGNFELNFTLTFPQGQLSLLSPVVTVIYGNPRLLVASIANHSSGDVSVGGGEAISGLQLAVQDDGGNLLPAPEFNATTSLWGEVNTTRTFSCRGLRSCTVMVNATIPTGSALLRGFLDIDVVCTDFDYATEFVSTVSVGGMDLIQTLGAYVTNGPWPHCYGSCSRTATLLSGYDVTNPSASGYFVVELSATQQVNTHPCDGNFLNAVLSLSLRYLYPVETGNELLGDILISSSGLEQTPVDIGIRTPGGPYVLQFSTHNLETARTPEIYVVIGRAASLKVGLQPGNATGGVSLPQQPNVLILDLGGNLVTYDSHTFVNASLITHAGGVSAKLSGTTSISAEQGVASFPDLAVNLVSAGYMLNFTAELSSGIYFVVSSAFTIELGPVTRLAIFQQPLWGSGGQSLSPAPVVCVADSGGNYAPSMWNLSLVSQGAFLTDESTVQAQIGVNGGVVGRLTGTLEISFNQSGCTVFDQLIIDKAGRSYNIIFQSEGLLPVESVLFKVAIGPADSLFIFRNVPGTAIAGELLGIQPIIGAVDKGGNVVIQGKDNVTASLLPPALQSGNDLRFSGQNAIPLYQGYAFFYDLRLMSPGIYSIIFSSNASIKNVSSSFIVVQYPSANATSLIGRAALVGLTISNFPGVRQLQFLSAVADAVGIENSYVAILAIDAENRTTTLASILLVTFKCTFASQSLASQAEVSISSSILKNSLIRKNLIVDVDSLVWNQAEKQWDIWSGWWKTTSSDGAGQSKIVFSTPDKWLQLWLNSSNQTLACAGPTQIQFAHVLCYDKTHAVFAGAFSNLGDGNIEGLLVKNSFRQTMYANFVRDMIYFVMENNGRTEMFVAVANSYNGSSVVTQSVIFSVNVTQSGQIQLTPYQSLVTAGAVAMEHVNIYGNDFLIVANHYNDVDNVLFGYFYPSTIYFWDRSTAGGAKFVPVQIFQTLGASDIEIFRIKQTFYLAAANYFNGTNYDLDSVIYQLTFNTNGTLESAMPSLSIFQTIHTIGAHSLKYAQLNSEHFLLISNERNNTIQVLRWNQNRFEEVHVFLWESPGSMELVWMQSSLMVAITSTSNHSVLLYLDDSGVLRVAQVLETGPSLDIKFFASNQMYYLAVVLFPVSQSANGSTALFSWSDVNMTFQLGTVMPSYMAASVLFVPLQSGGALLTGNGWGPGIDIFLFQDILMRRQATHLEISEVGNQSIYSDDGFVFTTQNHLPFNETLGQISLQLMNAETPSVPGDLEGTVCLLVDGIGQSSTVLGETQMQIDAYGRVNFADVRIDRPCQTVNLTFAATGLRGPILEVTTSQGRGKAAIVTLELVVPGSIIGSTGNISAAVVRELIKRIRDDALIGFNIENESTVTIEIILRSTFEANLIAANLSTILTTLSGTIQQQFNNASIALSLKGVSPALPPPGSRLYIRNISDSTIISGNPFSVVVGVQDCFGDELEFALDGLEVIARPNLTFALGNNVTSVVNGIAHFTDLIIGASGLNLVIKFSSDNLTSAILRVNVSEQIFNDGSASIDFLWLNGSSVVLLEEKIVVYGGLDDSEAVQRMVEITATSPFEAVLLQPFGWNPPGRYMHSSCASNGSMYVYGGFGGVNGGTFLGGLFRYDLTLNEWFNLSGRPGEPQQSSVRTLLCVADIFLVIYGGINDDVIHIFDLRNANWQNLTTPSGFEPAAIRPFGFAAYETTIILCQDWNIYYSADLPNGIWKINGRTSVPSILNASQPLTLDSDSSYASALVASEDGIRMILIGYGPRNVRQNWILQLDSEGLISVPYVNAMAGSGVVAPTSFDKAFLFEHSPQHFLLIGGNISSTFAGSNVTIRRIAFEAAYGIATAVDPGPSLGAVGVSLDPFPSVWITDVQGNPLKFIRRQITVTVQAFDGNGPITTSGSSAISIAAGSAQIITASYTDLALFRISLNASLLFTSPGLDSGLYTPLIIEAGPIASIVVLQIPVGIIPQAPFLLQPQAILVDGGGNVVVSDSFSDVKASIEIYNNNSATPWSSIGSALLGNVEEIAKNGLVSWTDLAINLAYLSTSLFRLSFLRMGLPPVTSGNFSFTLKSAMALNLSRPEINISSGESEIIKSGVALSPFSITIVLAQQPDEVFVGDNTTNITASLSHNNISRLIGTSKVTVRNGQALFTDLSVNRTGSGYRIVFTAGSIQSVTSSPFNVVPADAVALFIMTEAQNCSGGAICGIQPIIGMQDSSGNLVLMSPLSVSVELFTYSTNYTYLLSADDNSSRNVGAYVAPSTNLTQAALSGHFVLGAANGYATFYDLSVNKVGQYWLRFSLRTSTGQRLASVVQTLIVTAGAPYQLSVLLQPSNLANGGQTFPIQPKLTVKDAGGNGVYGLPAAAVTAAISPTSGLLNNSTTVSFSLPQVSSVSAGNPTAVRTFSVNVAELGATAIFAVVIEGIDGSSLSENIANTTIYRLDGSYLTPMYRLFQQGASDCAFFSVSSLSQSADYLLITRSYDDILGYSTPSYLYRLDYDVSGFNLTIIQNLSTSGAVQATAFQAAGANFVAVANQGDGYSESSSAVYQWQSVDNGETDGSLVLYQTFETSLPYAVETFQFFGDTFLIYANYFNFTTLSLFSTTVVYRYDVESQNFVLFQELPTIGATGLATFEAEGLVYLAIACRVSATGSDNTSSPLFVFDAGTNRLVLVQEIAGAWNGAYSWAAFNANGYQWLALMTRPLQSQTTAELVLFLNDTSGAAGCQRLNCTSFRMFTSETLPSNDGSIAYARGLDNSDNLFVSRRGAVDHYQLRFPQLMTGNLSARFIGNSSTLALATFTDLAITTVGVWKLQFLSLGIMSTFSSSIAIVAGVPKSLNILVQPGNGFGGALLSPQPTVVAVDAGQNTANISSFNLFVSVTLINGQGSSSLGKNATLLGTKVANFSNPYATFSSLSIDLVGQSYRLMFTLGGIITPSTILSNTIVVSAGVASSFAILLQPSNLTVAAQSFPIQPSLMLFDAGGNPANASTAVVAYVLLAVDPTGLADILGTRYVYSAGNTANFTDLSIGMVGAGYAISFRVFGGGKELFSNAAGANISTNFSVAVGPAASVRAHASEVGRGEGTSVSPGVFIIPIASATTKAVTGVDQYLNGFQIYINTNETLGIELFNGPLTIISHDPILGSVSVMIRLASELLALTTLSNSNRNNGTHFAYRLFSPDGYFSVGLFDSLYHAECHGLYKLTSQSVNGKAVYIQTQENRTLLVSGSPGGWADGLYGRIDVLYAGWPSYKLQSGDYFLRSPNGPPLLGSNISGWEVSSSLGGVTLLMLNSSMVSSWNGAHLVLYSGTGWVVQQYSGNAYNLTSGPQLLKLTLADYSGGMCEGCRNDALDSSKAAQMEINASGNLISSPQVRLLQLPYVASIDNGGNVVMLLNTTDAVAGSQELVNATNPLIWESFPDIQSSTSVIAFRASGLDYVGFAEATSGFSNVTAVDGAFSEAVFDVDSHLSQWTTSTNRWFHVIDNANLRNGSGGCPSGWTCAGNVTTAYNRTSIGSPTASFESPWCHEYLDSNPTSTSYFASLGTSNELPEKDCVGPAGVVLGPGTASLSQSIFRGGVVSGDVYTLTFSAGNALLTSSASEPASLMTLSVYINGQMVLGPVTPPPIPEYSFGDYSVTYSPPTSDLPEATASFGKCPQITWPAVALATGVNLTITANVDGEWATLGQSTRTLVLAGFELEPATANKGRTSLWLQGTENHSSLHGAYVQTDLSMNGRPVFLLRQQGTQQSKTSGNNGTDYAYALYSKWSATWQIISRLARSSNQPPELFQPRDAASLSEVYGLVEAVTNGWFEQGSKDEKTYLEFGFDANFSYHLSDSIRLIGEWSWEQMELEPLQDLPTFCGLDWAYITVSPALSGSNSEMNLLAIANHFDDGSGSSGGSATYRTVSRIWAQSSNITTNQGRRWDLWQEIRTDGAVDIESFLMGGTAWLAIANFFDGTFHSLMSPLLRWNGTEFAVYQTFATNGAVKWQHLNCPPTMASISAAEAVAASSPIGVLAVGASALNQEFLLLLQTPPEETVLQAGMARIIAYRWNGTSFVEAQTIGTLAPGSPNASWDMVAFSSEEGCFFAVAGGCPNCTAAIFKYNQTSDSFTSSGWNLWNQGSSSAINLRGLSYWRMSGLLYVAATLTLPVANSTLSQWTSSSADLWESKNVDAMILYELDSVNNTLIRSERILGPNSSKTAGPKIYGPIGSGGSAVRAEYALVGNCDISYFLLPSTDSEGLAYRLSPL